VEVCFAICNVFSECCRYRRGAGLLFDVENRRETELNSLSHVDTEQNAGEYRYVFPDCSSPCLRAKGVIYLVFHIKNNRQYIPNPNRAALL
jgi:hypothetical protein